MCGCGTDVTGATDGGHSFMARTDAAMLNAAATVIVC